MPLCWTSGSQCSLQRWQIIWTSDLSSSYLTASLAKAFSIIALLLLLAVWKCLLMDSYILVGVFPALTKYYENSATTYEPTHFDVSVICGTLRVWYNLKAAYCCSYLLAVPKPKLSRYLVTCNDLNDSVPNVVLDLCVLD